MLTLAIDTAGDPGSVAIARTGRLVGSRRFEGRTHAGLLVPAIVDLLSEAGAGLPQLETIVVADGPGSFTGLRIGFATAFGLRRDAPGARIVAIPSLCASAAIVSSNGPVAAMYDALRGEVFAAVYDFSDAVSTLVEPAVATVEAVRKMIPGVGIAVGDGACLFPEAVREWTGRDPVDPRRLECTSAEGLITLVERGVEGVVVDDADNFRIDYGRRAEAQVRWEKENEAILPNSPG